MTKNKIMSRSEELYIFFPDFEKNVGLVSLSTVVDLQQTNKFLGLTTNNSILILY